MERRPRVLLVEDDPVSSSVLLSVLEHAGMQVDACGCARTAREFTARAMHDVWLIDAHLPDGEGIDLLASLRSHGRRSRAIAHTASRDPALHARLREAGFVDVLVKPLPASLLVTAVTLPAAAAVPGCEAAGAHRSGERWDDAQALRALGGRRDSLLALRGLFLTELPGALTHCRDAVRAGDAAALRAVLHRLEASCAFVGAAALMQRVHGLRERTDAATLAAFEHEANALLAGGAA